MKTIGSVLGGSLRGVVCAWAFVVLATSLSAADALRPNERAFLDRATEVIRQQRRLADVGAAQATTGELRAYALQLTVDYRDLSDGLEALVRRKGELPGAPAGGTSETYQQLAARTGTDFDREFVRLLAEQSDRVVRLFEEAANNLKDPEVREFATGALPLLRGHQNRSLELRKAIE